MTRATQAPETQTGAAHSVATKSRRSGGKYDIVDVEHLIAAALDGFCEEFKVTSPQDKAKVLRQIAAVAKDLKDRM